MRSLPCLDRARARADREPARRCREHTVGRTIGAAFALVSLAALVACEGPSADGNDPNVNEQPIANDQPGGGGKTNSGEIGSSESAPSDTGGAPSNGAPNNGSSSGGS